MSSPRIHKLPDQLVSRIAAGEVVERPASVLKELLENSLDAGSKRIEISIQGAGRTLIRIADDGCGMTAEEARLSLERHATSKIQSFDDLENLSTFGFRGEALPSIAAVSRFRLVTRSSENNAAWEIQRDGGKTVSDKPAAREQGTTIEIKDLFFNTPARFKFLKSDATERGQCLRVIEEVVFGSAGREFKIEVESGKPMVISANDSLTDRISKMWNQRAGDSMVPVSASEKHFSVSGVVSSPDGHAATARNQVLYVNRRPVSNRRLTRAIYDAYVGQLHVGRHPSWVLFLEVNPQAVDVNVHPSKREVKLAFENEIFGFMVSAIKSALGRLTFAPSVWAVGGMPERDFEIPVGTKNPGSGIPTAAAIRDYSVLRDSRNPFGGSPSGTLNANVETLYRPIAPLKNQTFRAIAQLDNMFILAESREGLAIIDQHAAAEKVLYEKLMAEKKSAQPKMQMLLVPFSWEVAVSLAPAIKEKLSALQAFGFAIEHFGGSTFLVKGYPSDLGEKFDLLTLLDGLSDVLGENTESRGSHERGFDHKVAAMAACKGSVRAGDPLDLKLCQALLDQLVRLEAPHTCPHGRPTLVQMSYPELQRRFRRI